VFLSYRQIIPVDADEDDVADEGDEAAPADMSNRFCNACPVGRKLI